MSSPSQIVDTSDASKPAEPVDDAQIPAAESVATSDLPEPIVVDDVNRGVSADVSVASSNLPPARVPGQSPNPVSTELSTALSSAPDATIALKTLIVTTDAAIIIGKRGRNVNEIRDRSSTKITISETIASNPERIMTVTGPLDAVGKAFGLIVRRINDEPYDAPSGPGSKSVTIRFILPSFYMGPIIGKGGSKIREIQEASGARLQANEKTLPGSTERILSVSGVADAVHIAVYYLGTIIHTYNAQHAAAGHTLESNVAYKPGSAEPENRYTARGPGSMKRRRSSSRSPDRNGGSIAGNGYRERDRDRGERYLGLKPDALVNNGRAPGPPGPPLPPISLSSIGQTQSQQLFVPDEYVGVIIGKSGHSIKEIRMRSNCDIRIADAPEEGDGAPAGERLVTITGMYTDIQNALRDLYEKIENEKRRNSRLV